MRIHIPYNSNQEIGGGYTFYRNFIKGSSNLNDLTVNNSESDGHEILFAFSPTTINGETIERSKKTGAKFVLRIDGVPEDSRNSGRGTRQLVEYATKADLIIYQSVFIDQTVGRILRENNISARSVVVRNGVDTEVFNLNGGKANLQGDPKILNIAYRKDNNKRYEEVLAMFREYWTYNKKAKLHLLGRYPTEWLRHNMGFFNGENHSRLGVFHDDNAKALFIRSCDVFFFPSFADPAPNVVLEAMACGLPVIFNPYGGVAEYVGKNGVAIGSGKTYMEMIDEALKIDRKLIALETAQKFSLEGMVNSYFDQFKSIL